MLPDRDRWADDHWDYVERAGAADDDDDTEEDDDDDEDA